MQLFITERKTPKYSLTEEITKSDRKYSKKVDATAELTKRKKLKALVHLRQTSIYINKLNIQKFP